MQGASTLMPDQGASTLMPDQGASTLMRLGINVDARHKSTMVLQPMVYVIHKIEK